MEIVVPDEFKYLYEKSADRPVVKIPDPVLRKVCEPVNKIGKRTLFLIDDMVRAMKRENGIGLAAPQMGFDTRVIVIAPDGGRPEVLINPVIIHQEGSQVGEEGCLSIPGLYGDVERFEMVKVEAMDRKGREHEFEMSGLAARVVQHEIDHLNGVLFIDKVITETLHWLHPRRDEDDSE